MGWAKASAPPWPSSGSSTPTRTPPLPSAPRNYRYTLVLRPSPDQWPPNSVRSNTPKDPETKRKDRNQRSKEKRQKAKDQGICTKCLREPSPSGKSLCQQCTGRIRIHREQLKQKGLCIGNCGRLAEPSMTLCNTCNEAHSKGNKKSRDKTKEAANQSPIS